MSETTPNAPSNPPPPEKSETAVTATPGAAAPKPETAVTAPHPNRWLPPSRRSPKLPPKPPGAGWVLIALIATPFAMAWTAFVASMALMVLGTLRFLFPNVLTEPPSKFKVGFPDNYEEGKVVERFKDQNAWIVRNDGRLYALSTTCTHLGCTPNWLEREQKFKCPCHGSGFYITGINFEGPRPGPLERWAISIGDDGQVVVDKSKKFQQERGEWTNPESFHTRSNPRGSAHMPCWRFHPQLARSGRASSATRPPRDRRNRVVVMLTNVFLHLHPVSVRKSGIALSYTWCMGGLTFFLFLVETVTGVLLMFYYRPTLEYAYNDILLPARRDHARHSARAAPLGRPRHGHHHLAAHVPRVPHRQLQASARIQLGGRRHLAGVDAAAELHRLSAAVGPAGHLGHHGRQQHGPGHAVPRA